MPGVPGRVGCCLQDTRPCPGTLAQPSPGTGAACHPVTGRQGSGTEQQRSRPQTRMEPRCFSVPTTKLRHQGTARRYLPSPGPKTMSDTASVPSATHGYGEDTLASWGGGEVPLLPALAGTAGMLRQRAELPARGLILRCSAEQGEEEKATAAAKGHRDSLAPNGSNSS